MGAQAPCPLGTRRRRPHTGSGSGSSFRQHQSRYWGPRFCRRPGSALGMGALTGARARGIWVRTQMPRPLGRTTSPREARWPAHVTQLGAEGVPPVAQTRPSPLPGETRPAGAPPALSDELQHRRAQTRLLHDARRDRLVAPPQCCQAPEQRSRAGKDKDNRGRR